MAQTGWLAQLWKLQPEYGTAKRWLAAGFCGAFMLLAGLATAPAYGKPELVILELNNRQLIDFDTTVTGVNAGPWAGAGLAADPLDGQLDADAWLVDGMSSSSDLSRGISRGGVTTGGLYSFIVSDPSESDDHILGWQPTGSDFTPGSVTLDVLNLTGDTVTKWDLGYDIWQLNNGGRSSSLDFALAVGDGEFQTLSDLTFATDGTADAESIWELTSRSTRLELGVANGERLRLRWLSDDIGGSGSRDEFGIDNLQITALDSAAAIPEPSSAGCMLGGLASFALVAWRRRKRRSEGS